MNERPQRMEDPIMNPVRPLHLFIAVITLCLLSFQCTKPESAPVTPSITIEHLQAAYARSLKHQDMYVRFAAQAKKERFDNVHRLYRALARSEEIHAANHAALLVKLGVQPVNPSIDPPVVGRAVQTLRLAHSSEAIELVSMYDERIKAATVEQMPEALRLFTCSRNADTRHMDLLNDAMMKAGHIATTPYYVCPSCGLIMTDAHMTDCTGCKTPKDKYEKF